MKGEEIKTLTVILFFQMAKVEYITNYKVMYDIKEKMKNYANWLKKEKQIITFLKEFVS